ncbi:hypothetical protein [Alkaliphilus serpentinus]|uniref:Uncharacterized protein n=1 Tax=Alkaliphilus serpentinus TaxID=1482731 RepID=A0A833HMA2_9FIRM|nr:hypothetical protein [Alkaliphilus serpentinus]KAB3527275.1 hypothetical protein F8153_12485 [Alkaliphilus serpentinus]
MNTNDIDRNMSTDELLGLWVQYSNEALKGGNKDLENVEARQKLNAALATKGVSAIEIYRIANDEYTLKFIYRGSKRSKVIPIK